MIVSLTEKCSEGCSHCMINSLPRSPSMTEATLEKMLRFLHGMNNKVMLISGGEFTEHPQFFDFSTQLINAWTGHGRYTLLLSNGSWMFREGAPDQVRRLLEMPQVYGMQIRTHKRFYPNAERTLAAKGRFEAFHPKMIFFDDGIQLIGLGRARANHKDELEKKYPSCANLFLLAKQVSCAKFSDVLVLKEQAQKFCAPFISSQGVIHAGETPSCEVLGTIEDSEETILANLLTRCRPKNVCGLVKNLPEPMVRILGSQAQIQTGGTP